jgi:hypothetical protein
MSRGPTDRLLIAPTAALLALAICGVARCLAFLSGTRFSTSYLTYGWQLVPSDVLRDDPLGSVWHLGIQPPVFNLLVGSVLRWSPAPGGISLQVVYLALAGGTIVLSHDILVRVGARPLVATAITVFIFCDPDWLRYELTPQYECLTAFLIVATVWSAARVIAGQSTLRWLTLASLGTCTVLTRSLLHPLWLAVLLVAVLWYARGSWRVRDLLIVLLVPTTLIGGWALKNELMFDDASLSSFFGMNLQRASIAPLTKDQLGHLLTTQQISPLASVKPFSSYADYAPLLDACTPTVRHAAASVASRSNGVPNFNYQCYVPVYHRLGHDSWTAIRAYPGRYLYGRWWALRSSFGRGADPTLDRGFMHALDDVYRIPMLDINGRLPQRDWAIPLVNTPYIPTRTGYLLVACFLWQLYALGRYGWRVMQRRPPKEALTQFVAAFTVTWVMLVGTLFEIGENPRFRILVQPLLVGLPLVAAVRLAESGLAAHRRRAAVRDPAAEGAPPLRA